MRYHHSTFAILFPVLAAALLAPAEPALAQDFGPAAVVSHVVLPSGFGSDESPSVARDAAGHVVAVWESRERVDAATGTDQEIHVARSSNGGLTWSAPQILNSNAAADTTDFDTEPQVATDGAGTWIAIWSSYDSLGGTIGTDEDVLYSRSTDNGATWSAAAAVDPNAGADFGNVADRPQIAMDASGNVVVAWASDDPLGAPGDYNGKILVSRSSNSGATWTAAIKIDASQAYDAEPSLATDGDGTWIAAWTRQGDAAYGGDRDQFYARSTNNGATWSAPAPLNTNAASSSAEDYTLDLAAGGGGNWVAAWFSPDSLGGTIGTDHDILVTHSTDDGLTWSAPAALNSDAAMDTDSDYLVDVATDSSGTWIASWVIDESSPQPDQVLVYARSTDGGASWTTATQLSSSPTDSNDDRDAMLIGDGAGNWLAAWWSSDSIGGRSGLDSDILTSKSSDGGATWSAATWLNTNAPEDGDESKADIATNGDVWIAVWLSGDGLDGTIGRLAQYVAFARSTDGGASWSSPAQIASNAEYDSLYLDTPRIETDGSTWIVVWTSAQGALRTTRSTDDGVSWSTPVSVTPPGSVGILPAIATDGSSWGIAWTVYPTAPGPGADFDVAASRSSDGGQTWSAPVFVNTNAAVDSGFDIDAQIVIDGSSWIVVWTTSDSLGGTIGTDYDVAYALSADAGASWSPPAPLNSFASSDAGIDYSVSLVSDGAGRLIAAWQSQENLGGTIGTDYDILFSVSDDGGQSWSAAQVLSGNAATDSGADGEVELATDAAGKWVAVWSSTDTFGGTIGSDNDLLVARSADNGSTWTFPETMIASAATDAGHDESAALATDGAGTWMTLWQSNDSSTGLQSGVRPNIFVSVASVCGGACDDGNPCTQDSCDAEGACLHLDAPALTCRAGTKSSLAIEDGALAWKLSGAAATSQAEFGDPTAGASYTLCLYDQTGSTGVLDVPAGGTCDGKPCWKALSTKGYGYKDKAGASDGVKKVSLKASADAKTKVLLKASGASLPPASLPLTGSIAVQLHNSSSQRCWESVFTGDDILSDGSGGKLKAKAK